MRLLWRGARRCWGLQQGGWVGMGACVMRIQLACARHAAVLVRCELTSGTVNEWQGRKHQAMAHGRQVSEAPTLTARTRSDTQTLANWNEHDEWQPMCLCASTAGCVGLAVWRHVRVEHGGCELYGRWQDVQLRNVHNARQRNVRLA